MTKFRDKTWIEKKEIIINSPSGDDINDYIKYLNGLFPDKDEKDRIILNTEYHYEDTNWYAKLERLETDKEYEVAKQKWENLEQKKLDAYEKRKQTQAAKKQAKLADPEYELYLDLKKKFN